MENNGEVKIEEEVKWLPNPELIRESIVPNCEGCKNVFENHTLPEGMVLVDVCICYEMPSTKWRNYKIVSETIKKSGKDVPITYYYSPCPMATHIKHSPKPDPRIVQGRVRVKRK
jgi:hypothetical protein